MISKPFLNLMVGTITILGSSTSHANSVGDWIQGLPVQPGVVKEMSKFDGLSSRYLLDFPNIMKQRMQDEFNRATQQELQNQTCHDQLNISFPNKLTDASSTDPRALDFESQFIRIEAKSCLPGADAAKVASIYLSPEYQRNAFDTVVSNEQQGNRVCQATETFGLGRSEYCYNNSVLQLPQATFIHSFNDWNRDNIAAPVYFREMLTASLALPKGTLFYTLVYVRGVSLNSLFKTLAKSKIKSSQQKAIELLGSMSQRPQ